MAQQRRGDWYDSGAQVALNFGGKPASFILKREG